MMNEMDIKPPKEGTLSFAFYQIFKDIEEVDYLYNNAPSSCEADDFRRLKVLQEFNLKKLLYYYDKIKAKSLDIENEANQYILNFLDKKIEQLKLKIQELQDRIDSLK